MGSIGEAHAWKSQYGTVAAISLTCLFAFLAASAVRQMLPNTLGALCAGLLSGVVSGLVLRRLAGPLAGAVGASAGALAIALGDWTASPQLPVVVALVTGLFAGWLVAEADAERHRRITYAALAAIIALMVLAVWVRLPAPAVNGKPLIEWLGEPSSEIPAPDADYYARVGQRTIHGEDYYSAALAELERRGQLDLSVTSVRLPTMFWIWRMLPANPVGIVLGLLMLGVLATLATYDIGRRFAPGAFALASAACVAYMYVLFTTSAMITYVEVWASPFVIFSFACWSRAAVRGSANSAYWVLASMASALMAAAIRETAVLVLLGGLVIALINDLRRGTKWSVPWAIGLAAWLGFMFFHARQCGLPLLGQSSASGVTPWLSPGIDRLVNTASAGDDFVAFRDSGASVVLIALTIAGICRPPIDSQRLFALLAIAAPLCMFFFVGPTDLVNNVPLGYWGLLLKPAMWSLAPGIALIGATARAEASRA